MKHLPSSPNFKHRYSKTSCEGWKIREMITVEPGYNDIGLHDTSSTASDILLYQVISHS
jgi:hypothetical protein